MDIDDLDLIALPSSKPRPNEVTAMELDDILHAPDTSPTKSHFETLEMLEVPESPVVISRTITTTKLDPVRPPNLVASPKSAPIKRCGQSKSVQPTSSSGYKKRKKRSDYPNLMPWTEDGTDGINPRPPSPMAEDDGIISALLEGLLSSPPPHRPGGSPKNKSLGRVSELIDSESDGAGSKESSDGQQNIKRTKASSEPRPEKRQLLSPDLAAKNKGKGRYATSLDIR